MYRIAVYSADKGVADALSDALGRLDDPNNIMKTAVPAELTRVDGLARIGDMGFDVLLCRRADSDPSMETIAGLAGDKRKVIFFTDRQSKSDKCGPLAGPFFEYIVCPFDPEEIVVRLVSRARSQGIV